MKTRAVLLFVAFALAGFSSGRAAPAQSRALVSIERAIFKLTKEPHFHIKVTGKYLQAQNSANGTMEFFVNRKPFQYACRLSAHAGFQGMKIDAAGESRFLNNGLYFILKQSPIGKPEYIGRWFELNLNEAARALGIDLTRLPAGKAVAAIPKIDLSPIHVRLDKNAKMGEVVCRHFSAVIPLGTFLQLYFSMLPKNFPMAPTLQPLMQMAAGAPPIKADFWIGAADGRLYQMTVPIQKSGSVRVTIAYHLESTADVFTVPSDTTDGRALGFALPSALSSAVFPAPAPAQAKTVGPIGGTMVYFQPVNPYGGPSMDALKAFCATAFNLNNVTVLPPIQTPDQALNGTRLQYSGEEILNFAEQQFAAQNLAAPNHYLIVITDQDIYSSKDPSALFTPVLTDGVNAIISFNRLRSTNPDDETARGEKLLGRTLGMIYWKLPFTTLSQDLMYEGMKTVPDDLDRMGTAFLEDKSMELANEAMTMSDASKARELFQEAIQYNPLHAKYYYLLGVSDFHAGAYQDASADLNKSLMLDPTNADAFYFLAQTYVKLNDPADALAEYHGELLINPDRSDGYYGLSAIYGQMGENAKAQAALNRARELSQQGH